jgi:hypothetical protein
VIMAIKFYSKFFTKSKGNSERGDTNRLNKKEIMHTKAKFSKRRHYSDAIQARILFADDLVYIEKVKDENV